MRLIKFFIDKEVKYLDSVTNEVLSQEDVDRLEKERVGRDRKAGYRDRLLGYYDKWYRYNRSDNGAAYDEGQKEALLNPNCSGEMVIIPCIN